MPDPRDALEAALVANPDDLALHAAYADLLVEQGDPRGEFIQVQLALEDASRPARERKRLQTREAKLLQAHQREWLGELAPVLLDDEYNRERRRDHWARGWLSDLYLWSLNLPGARALARCAAARLLRRLHIDHSFAGAEEAEPGDGVPEGAEHAGLYPLQRAPFLAHLRVLQVGETVDFEDETYDSSGTTGEGVTLLLRQASRLEELYLLARNLALGTLFALRNLTELRVLQVYHEVGEYPLKVLARNPAFRRLTTLRMHPAHADAWEGSYLPLAQVRALLRSPNLPSLAHLHLHASDLGDTGCREVVRSGILKRLKTLDLRHGCVTDGGARVLAECPDIRRLELLSLEDNQLTDEGRALLQGLGIPVRCQYQSEPGSERYLYSGDME